MHCIEIVSHEVGVVKTMGPFSSERQAKRCEDGVNINLDHENYFTRVVIKHAASQPSAARVAIIGRKTAVRVLSSMKWQNYDDATLQAVRDILKNATKVAGDA